MGPVVKAYSHFLNALTKALRELGTISNSETSLTSEEFSRQMKKKNTAVET